MESIDDLVERLQIHIDKCNSDYDLFEGVIHLYVSELEQLIDAYLDLDFRMKGLLK